MVCGPLAWIKLPQAQLVCSCVLFCWFWECMIGLMVLWTYDCLRGWLDVCALIVFGPLAWIKLPQAQFVCSCVLFCWSWECMIGWMVLWTYDCLRGWLDVCALMVCGPLAWIKLPQAQFVYSCVLFCWFWECIIGWMVLWTHDCLRGWLDVCALMVCVPLACIKLP